MAQSYETGARQREMRDALKSPAHDVAEDFAALRKDLAKLASAMGRVAQSQFNNTGSQLQEASRHLSSRAKDGAEYVGGHVRERPISALGVSLGVGVIVGLALASFSRR